MGTRIMTGAGTIESVQQVASMVPAFSPAGEKDLAAGQGLRWHILSLSGNALVALFYALFLYSNIRFWSRTGSLVGLGLVIFNTILVACLLARRRPTAVTACVRNWILAPLTQILALLLRPVGSVPWPALIVSTAGQIMGLSIMTASLIALNRSIGIVAANRGITTHGPYAWVRHPLYAGEILFFASYLISNWNYQNSLLVSLLILGQVVRCRQEEAVLSKDERYAAYKAAVAYRLIPGIF